jgi:hypothetical protein
MTETNEEPKVKRVIEYEGTLIGEVQRTGGVSIRCYLREKDGHPYLDLRKFTDNTRYCGPLKGQGITIPPEAIAGVIELLVKGGAKFA